MSANAAHVAALKRLSNNNQWFVNAIIEINSNDYESLVKGLRCAENAIALGHDGAVISGDKHSTSVRVKYG